MATPLSLMLEIIIQETKRLKERSDEDMCDLNDIKRLETLASTYTKIRQEIRTTKKQSALENKNLEEQLELAQEAMDTLRKR